MSVEFSASRYSPSRQFLHDSQRDQRLSRAKPRNTQRPQSLFCSYCWQNYQISLRVLRAPRFLHFAPYQPPAAVKSETAERAKSAESFLLVLLTRTTEYLRAFGVLRGSCTWRPTRHRRWSSLCVFYALCGFGSWHSCPRAGRIGKSRSSRCTGTDSPPARCGSRSASDSGPAPRPP